MRRAVDSSFPLLSIRVSGAEDTVVLRRWQGGCSQTGSGSAPYISELLCPLVILSR